MAPRENAAESVPPYGAAPARRGGSLRLSCWGWLATIWLLGCGDGVARPIRVDVLSAAAGTTTSGAPNGAAVGVVTRGGAAGQGGAATAGTDIGGAPVYGASGSGGVNAPDLELGGDAGAAELLCRITAQWPAALVAAEEEMFVALDGLRRSGAACGGAVAAPSSSLVRAPQLQCFARAHSMTAFSFDLPLPSATVVAIASETLEQLDIPALVQSLVDEGGDACNDLLAARHTRVGIGVAEVGGLGYWTFYLTGS